MRGTYWINGQKALKATWMGMRVGGRYSERLGGWFAARLWFTPWRAELSDRARLREENWLSQTEPFTVRFDGSELRGYTAGNGPTILLVHGWGERAATMGAFIAPLTRAGFRVVAIDLPGHGETKVSETNLFVIADAVKRTAEAVGGVHAVIAHSMGGMAAILALNAGVEAERVVLLAPAVRIENGLEKFNSLFALPPKAATGLRKHIERRFGADIWQRLSGDLIAPRFELPALVIHDEEDPQVDFADGRLLADVWPGANLISTSGLGHVKIVRDPRSVAEAVGFLTGQDDSAISVALDTPALQAAP